MNITNKKDNTKMKTNRKKDQEYIARQENKYQKVEIHNKCIRKKDTGEEVYDWVAISCHFLFCCS